MQGVGLWHVYKVAGDFEGDDSRSSGAVALCVERYGQAGIRIQTYILTCDRVVGGTGRIRALRNHC